MRATIPGLQHPHALVGQLPAIHQQDDFTRRFVAAFDDLLAPVLSTIDQFDTYLDPWLAPADFVGWLAGWVGVELDQNWSDEQQRRLVATGVRRHARRGTRAGLSDDVVQFLGVDRAQVDVTDSGEVSWAASPSGEMPGSWPPSVVVALSWSGQDDPDTDRLTQLVREVVPVHVAVTVRVVRP